MSLDYEVYNIDDLELDSPVDVSIVMNIFDIVILWYKKGFDIEKSLSNRKSEYRFDWKILLLVILKLSPPPHPRLKEFILCTAQCGAIAYYCGLIGRHLVLLILIIEYVAYGINSNLVLCLFCCTQ